MPSIPLNNDLIIHYLDPSPDVPRAVLLLHGLGANGTSWSLQFDSLREAGLRPLAPDLRGFGQSSFAGGPINIEGLAADMAALMNALDLEQAHLVGISLGGTVALAFAMAFPEKVDKLLLVNTAAWILPDDLRTWLYYAVRLFVVFTLGIPRQSRIVSQRIFPEPDQAPFRRMLEEQIQQADPRAYRGTMLALARFDARPRLKHISAPTLVITGDRDTTIRRDRQRQLAAGIPHARHVVIKGAGHAVTVEKPAEINPIMIDFLTQGGFQRG
jgi:pimeloyl-ACP methyl ester carboxylesterase